MENACGGCTACCKTHAVTSISKEMGAWCVHSRACKGCAIYNTRPDECRSFECAWLHEKWPLRYRPDKTKIVPEFKVLSGIGIILALWEVKSGALQKEHIQKWTRRNLLGGNHVVHIPVVGNPKLYLPPGKEKPQFVMVLGSVEDGWLIDSVPFV